MEGERRESFQVMKKQTQKTKWTKKLERPIIPQALVQATLESIRRGMRPDALTKRVHLQLESKLKLKPGDSKASLRLSPNPFEDDPERTYQHLHEHRHAILIIGESQETPEEEKTFFLNAPPLDYSFCYLSNIEEIVKEAEHPQKNRNLKEPEQDPAGRYKTSSLRLSFNFLETLGGIIGVISKTMDLGPRGLAWLDLSHNNIQTLDEDALSQLPNLKILYLHANSINDMTEIPKLSILTNLFSLTLHGNPIENEEGYRHSILYHLPTLKNLDFFPVTKTDRFNGVHFGPQHELKWKRKHRELKEQKEAAAKELNRTTTSRMLDVDQGPSSLSLK